MSERQVRTENLANPEKLKAIEHNFLLTSPNSLFEAVVDIYCEKVTQKNNGRRVGNLNLQF